MKTSTAKLAQYRHEDHVFKIGALLKRTEPTYPLAVRLEAQQEILSWRDNGLILQEYGKEVNMAQQKTRAHAKPDPKTFSGQGIIFAVVDDREEMRTGRVTTIDVIADGIEKALDNGKETSEDIARYLTTSAFQHVPDKRVRFNSILKAGDAVGAMITRKLYNAYNELAAMADEEEDAKKKATLKEEARGFAEALNVVISPFSCEDSEDPRLVNWDEVDRITANFEKEQREVRRARKGNPQ